MKTATFVLVCLVGFLYFASQSAEFATALKQLQITKIETALQ